MVKYVSISHIVYRGTINLSVYNFSSATREPNGFIIDIDIISDRDVIRVRLSKSVYASFFYRRSLDDTEIIISLLELQLKV